MRLPRNLTGAELAALLRRHYGYEVTRQKGSHIRLTSTHRDREHHVTIPRHNPLRVGTLSGVLGDVADYMGVARAQIAEELFHH